MYVRPGRRSGISLSVYEEKDESMKYRRQDSTFVVELGTRGSMLPREMEGSISSS